ncbi:late embryogenesis abundant protein D-29 isoform X2 [Benincasa hispida]|uniref:late embryogenesis abundant protein D-29 isoform X2 n=1 Tax=Benincasa hispida TaxID=102211 RepID=UPI001900B5A3|nr:late embryogenesis abundant protein D-29 isoform X2 [Benincasa hispida]
MGRTSMLSVVAVVWLLLVADKCRGMGEEALQDVKDNVSEITKDTSLDEKAEAVKSGASDVFHDAKENAESWSNWAYGKISKGLGFNGEELKETAHYVVDKAGDAATKTTEKVSTAASDASNYASEKAGEAVKAASDAAGNLKSKSGDVIGTATEKASDIKTKAKETLVDGKDKAAEVYEAAKNEVGQKFKAAKENVNCVAAKEMASKSAGEIGYRIREKTAEL